jgi:hypothetical protein
MSQGMKQEPILQIQIPWQKWMERKVLTRQERGTSLVHRRFQHKGTVAGAYGCGTGKKLSLSLGKYTTVFQAVDNLYRSHRNRNICILWDSQTTIKALDNYQINSKLVLDCHKSPTKLSEHNNVQLIWVLGRRGIEGNETADQLARCGNWVSFHRTRTSMQHLNRNCQEGYQGLDRDYKTYWESLTGLKACKGFPTRTLPEELRNY